MVRCDDQDPESDFSSTNGGGDLATAVAAGTHSGAGGQRVKLASEASARAAAAALSKKMDKSSVLRSTIDFLRLYYESKKSGQSSEAGGGEGSSRTPVGQEDEEERREEGDAGAYASERWKPSFLSGEEFAYLMLDVSRLSLALLHHHHSRRIA